MAPLRFLWAQLYQLSLSGEHHDFHCAPVLSSDHTAPLRIPLLPQSWCAQTEESETRPCRSWRQSLAPVPTKLPNRVPSRKTSEYGRCVLAGREADSQSAIGAISRIHQNKWSQTNFRVPSIVAEIDVPWSSVCFCSAR